MHISSDIQSWFVIIYIKKVKIAIVGSGLAGLTAAVNLVDEGHEVEIYIPTDKPAIILVAGPVKDCSVIDFTGLVPVPV